MQALVLGGSASGKSEFAENLAVSRNNNSDTLLYIATMKPFGKEAETRIARHRLLRAKKGFDTIECYKDLSDIDVPPNSTILLECIGNLLANEMFENLPSREVSAESDLRIIEGVQKLSQRANNLILVSNDIFSDGNSYEMDTLEYQNLLAKINIALSETSAEVIEVTCGIPIYHKGGPQ